MQRPPTPAPELKDGLYIRFDQGGNVTDFGGRVEGSGNIGKATFGDSMDFTLIGINPIAGAIGR
jgi:hypothetical protein